GCSEGSFCITDAQLQSEVAQFISNNSLPANDLTREYFVLTPPSVVSCFDSAGKQCSGNAIDDSAKFFCGYHSASSTSPEFIYANIPDLVGLVGCDPFTTTGQCLSSI